MFSLVACVGNVYWFCNNRLDLHVRTLTSSKSCLQQGFMRTEYVIIEKSNLAIFVSSLWFIYLFIYLFTCLFVCLFVFYSPHFVLKMNNTCETDWTVPGRLPGKQRSKTRNTRGTDELDFWFFAYPDGKTLGKFYTFHSECTVPAVVRPPTNGSTLGPEQQNRGNKWKHLLRTFCPWALNRMQKRSVNKDFTKGQ